MPENYRPISLLQVSYKIFAGMILRRFKIGGIEEQLWHTQFGFRSKSGTEDANFVARRLIERCFMEKSCHFTLVALDWSRAFDSIDPSCLIAVLRRFHLPAKFLRIIEKIYCNRKFEVIDCGSLSNEHHQHFGISQGCPLSPFLFIMLMTILLYDANEELMVRYGISFSDQLCSELVYADDTLLVGQSVQGLQKYMDCIGAVGKKSMA